MRKLLNQLKLPFIIFLTFCASYCLNTYFSFDPYNVDPVPEVTANAQQPADRQVPFRHIPVTLSTIPVDCQQATIAIEDHNFYSHIGIDAAGLVRGLIGEVTGVDAGGSTLNQQLAKNIAEQIYSRSYLEKLDESLQAIRLNFAYTKAEILEMYLNSVYYGNYNFGMAAASQNYFGKNISVLSLAECAYLAGLPQSPSIYNPYANVNAGIVRQHLVLQAMLNENYISLADEKAALNTTLVFVSH